MATVIPPPPPPKPVKSHQKPSAATNNSNNNHVISSTASHNGNGLSAATKHLSISNSNIISSSSSTPPSLETENVVMTPRPRSSTNNATIILIERKLVEEIGDRQHVAGGDHTGIIINKDALNEQKSISTPAQLSLEFRVFLISANTGQHSQESRSLRYWFRPWLTDGDKQAHVAQDFFTELVKPKEFPRGKRAPFIPCIFFFLIIIILFQITLDSLRKSWNYCKKVTTKFKHSKLSCEFWNKLRRPHLDHVSCASMQIIFIFLSNTRKHCFG